MISTLLAYLSAVLHDGDALNDWLTHLPASVVPFALSLGRFLAQFIP